MVWPSALALLVTGLIVGGVFVFVIWWALFGDRGRGRRRCPRCWHDLSATPGQTCGECGFAARREGDLHRPRRRLGIAGGALVALLAGVSVVHWNASEVDYYALVPTRVLLWSLPWSEWLPDDVPVELSQRISRRELSDEQRRDLLERCLVGDSTAAPGSPAWARRYGAFLGWWQRRDFANEEERSRLLALPPQIVASALSVPEDGAPAFVRLWIRDWWPPETDVRVTIRPQVPGATPLIVGRGGGVDGLPIPVLVPGVDGDVKEIVFTVEIARREPPGETSDADADSPSAPGDGSRRRRWSSTEPTMSALPLDPALQAMPWQVIESTELRIPVEAETPLAARLEPVDTPEIDEAMTWVFAHGISRWTGGARRYGLRFAMNATRTVETSGVLYGVEAELLEGGTVLRTTRLWWMGGTDRSAGWEFSEEDLAALDAAWTRDSVWTLRLRGRRDLALRTIAALGPGADAVDLERHAAQLAPVLDGTAPIRWWSGEIEIPIRLNDESGPGPTRPWRVELGQWPVR